MKLCGGAGVQDGALLVKAVVHGKGADDGDAEETLNVGSLPDPPVQLPADQGIGDAQGQPDEGAKGQVELDVG